MRNGRTPADDRPEKGNHEFTKRIPIPYHASMHVDNALMELAELNRAAMILVADREPPADERMRRLAQIIHHAHQATEELKEIRKPDENKNLPKLQRAV